MAVIGSVYASLYGSRLTASLPIGCLVAGGVAAAGAILAVVFLPAQPASPSVPSEPSVSAASPAEESARF